MEFNGLQLNGNVTGQIVQAQDVYSASPTLNRFVSARLGDAESTVTLTGYCIEGSTYWWYQTTGGLWVPTDGNARAVGTSTAAYTAKQAQALVNRIISNNKRVYENNLLCARFAARLSVEELSAVKGLQTRLAARDQALRDNSGITSASVSYPTGYANEMAYLDTLMGGSSGKVGVVLTTTALIVISCVVAASLATAVYFAFAAWAAESDEDVKYSDGLTKTLTEKLTDEEYAQLKSETAGIVTKARLKERFASAGSLLKYALAGTAAYMIYKRIKDRRN